MRSVETFNLSHRGDPKEAPFCALMAGTNQTCAACLQLQRKVEEQATSLTFTDYLARLRIEKVKNLLINPHKRISEAAYEAGFQSLSQFNRVFRKIAGESPTVWRAKVRRGHTTAA